MDTFARPGSALASYRRLHDKVCPHCGKAFVGIATKVYCGLPCLKKAKRARDQKAGVVPASNQGEKP